MKRIEMVGLRFGRFVVVAPDFSRERRHLRWLCRCDCGQEKSVAGPDLRCGDVVSCGCYRKEASSAKATVHGATKGGRTTPEFRTWQGMIKRCENQRAQNFARYGARGVQVCERWHDFASFLADMGPKPSAAHSIDRIDNRGHYEPGNCRWATPQEQARNTSTNHELTHDGRTMCVAAWAEVTGLSHFLITLRLRRGWSVARTLTEPPHNTKKAG